jgi:hypothetical protein
MSNIYNTGGPPCLSCNYIKRVSAFLIPQDSKSGTRPPVNRNKPKIPKKTALLAMIGNFSKHPYQKEKHQKNLF